MLWAEGFRHEGAAYHYEVIEFECVISILPRALPANPLESSRAAPTVDFLQTQLV